MPIYLEMIELHGEQRIKLTGWDGPDTPAKCKAISGARALWENEKFQFWYYPLDMTIARLLRQSFPSLTIGPELTAWARAENTKHKTLLDYHVASSAEPVQLEMVAKLAPTMWAAMRERGFQTVVPAFAKSIGNYFNGSQTGLGKTIETLASLLECDISGMVLVVAPKKALRATWLREINKWLAVDMPVNIDILDSEFGSLLAREKRLAQMAQDGHSSNARFHFVLINPEMLRWEFTCSVAGCNGKRKTCPQRESHDKAPMIPSLFKIEWDAIILDETHKMMMNSNWRSASVSGWGYGAQKLRVKKGGLKIAASATPFKGKPRRFWPVLHWLRSDLYVGQGKWTAQYFEMESDAYAYAGQKPTDIMREDRRGIFYQDLNKIMIRHTKRELHAINRNWAPPEVQHVDIFVEMESKQRRAYRQMEKHASALLDSGVLMADGILAELTRLKQLANSYGSIDGTKFTPMLPSAKWDWILEALEERGIAGDMNDGEVKIVIASQFTSLLDLFHNEFDRIGIPHFMITGKTPSKLLTVTQNTWQDLKNTQTRVMLLSTQAGGVSLTLDAADDMFIVDETFVPDDQEQVIGRIHRTGRTDHQVTAYHLYTAGTIDENIATDNVLKDISQNDILDGRRGVEYYQRMLGKSA